LDYYYTRGYASSNEEATENVQGKQDGILNDKLNGQSMRMLSTYTLGTTFYYTFFSAIWKTAISGNHLVLKVMRFSAPIQTSPGAHPASYTMGTGSLSQA